MFNKIQKMAVSKDAVRVYTFENIDAEKPPSLRVRYAGEGNTPYINAILAYGRKQVSKGKVLIDEVHLDKNRRQDRELYPKYVIVGWEEPMVTDEGRPATDADIPDFIAALPIDMMDGLRAYCSNPENYRGGTEAAVGN